MCITAALIILFYLTSLFLACSIFKYEMCLVMSCASQIYWNTMTVVTLPMPYVVIKTAYWNLCLIYKPILQVFSLKSSCVNSKSMLPTLRARGKMFYVDNLYTVKPLLCFPWILVFLTSTYVSIRHTKFCK